MDETETQLKLLIIGESGVGKTSILQRFIDNTFQTGFTSTIGIDFRSKKIAVNGQEVELQIWDTAGQERFFSITKSYYRGADGIFLTFDLSSDSSFKSTEKWIAAIQSKIEEKVPIFLLGNKKDLVQHENWSTLPTLKKINQLADQLAIPCYVTSAQSGENIEEIFTDMAKKILQQKQPRPAANKKYRVSTKSLRKVFSCW